MAENTTSVRTRNEAIRNAMLTSLIDFLYTRDEEVLITGSNEIAVPVVDSAGDEKFVVITVKVPTGSRDGEPYDGYSVAEDYKLHLDEKAAKAAEAAKRKAEKIERDRKAREERAKAKAERKAQSEG